MVISGIVGSILAGFLLEYLDKDYKKALVVAYLGSGVSLIAFYFSVRPDFFGGLAVACGAVGFFLIAILPISLEMAVELT
jgi:hypothetical protein